MDGIHVNVWEMQWLNPKQTEYINKETETHLAKWKLISMNNIKNSSESLKAERPIEVDLPVKTQKCTLCCAKCDIQHPNISKILHTEISSKKMYYSLDCHNPGPRNGK